MYRPKAVNPNVLASFRRFQSQFNVAIIGSGPAGFYTAHHLINKNPNVQVNIFEKLPTPFGLSRYGVAPDHPEVKNCEDTFNQVAENERFKFFGNITVGKDISLKELHKNYNAVVFSYGCTQDNKLGIPGEELPGVISARKFVGWYNGLPECQDLNPPLNKIEDVVIIGNGNVAIDCARILLTPPEVLSKTDISDKAVQDLKSSTLKNIKIVARRGFLESAFTNKEIRELLELEKYGVKFEGVDPKILDPIIPFKNKFDRITSRRLDLILNQMKPPQERKKLKYKIPEVFTKSWKLEYLQSPIEAFENSKNKRLVSSINLQENQLYHESPDSPAKVKSIPGATHLDKAELVITSIGYKGVSIPGMDELGIIFNERNGTILNDNGRVLAEDHSVLPGFYASGWIRKGSAGVIASTMMDSFTSAGFILEDFEKGLIKGSDKKGFEKLDLGKSVVSWEDWEKLNKFEKKLGESFYKSRYKVMNVDQMLEIIRDDSTNEDERFEKYKELVSNQ